MGCEYRKKEPLLLSFEFYKDIEIWAQGQMLSLKCVLPLFCQKYEGVWIKHIKKLHRQVAHDFIIFYLELTYFCKEYEGLKLSIL